MSRLLCYPKRTFLAISVGLLYHIFHATDPEDGFQLNIGKWVVTFYVLTMTTNVLSSGELITLFHLVTCVTLS